MYLSPDTSDGSRPDRTTDACVNLHESRPRPRTRLACRKRSILLSILCGQLLLAVTANAQPATKRVLIVTSYDLNRPAVIVFLQAMRSTITAASKERVEFFYEFQENTRISTDKYEAAMVSYMKQKYEGEKFDLTVALGAPAVKILLDHEAELFPGTPRIFYFHDETENKVRNLWPRATGVWAQLDISKTVNLALQLQPETNHVVVVSGSSGQDRFLQSQAQTQLRTFEGRLKVTYLNDLSMAELKNRLASLPPNTIVLYLSFFLDSTGNSYSGPEALSLFAPTSSAPIYGVSETYMGAGIVGGSLLNFEALGRRTGEVALRVLAGEQVSNIPPESVSNFQVIDWRQLKRWGIDERRVPADSTVRFKIPTFWDHYKWYVLAVITALIIQSSLIAWLLLMRTRRRQAEATAEKTHRRLHSLLSDIPGIVWETHVDPVTGNRKVSFISDYVRKMLGYTPQEWLSTPGFGLQIVEVEDRERVTKAADAVLTSGKEGITEFRWRTKDGQIRWAESYLNTMTDGNAETIGLRGVTLDVTQRKAAEASVLESEERFSKAFRSNPQPMSLTTIDEDRYLDVNDSFLAMSGYTRDDLLGHTSVELGIWETSESRVDFVEQLKQHGSVVNTETRFRAKDGSIHFLLSSAEQLEVAGKHCLLLASTDITERKNSLEALREAHEQLHKLKDQLEAENIYLQEELRGDPKFGDIVGRSDAINKVLQLVSVVAPTEATVLITGETGTGKELVARAIHAASSRQDRPLIKVNCGLYLHI